MYITCWIEGIQTDNETLISGSGCDNAPQLAENGELDDATNMWALFSSMVNIGALFGALFGGPICDRIGRKNTIIANSVAAVIVKDT